MYMDRKTEGMTTSVFTSDDMNDNTSDLLFWGKSIFQIEKSIRAFWRKKNLYSFSVL